jgi:hypothetical protein
MAGNNTKNGKCPLPEVISAYFDGALEAGSPEARHIKSCPECNKVLNSYAAIARALKSMRQTKNTAALVSSITAGVHRKLQEPLRSSIPFTKYILRIAATALIAGVALYFAASSMLNTAPQKVAVPTSQPNLAAAAAKQDKQELYPYYTGSDSGVLSGAIAQNAVPLQNLVNVDYGNSFNPVFKLDSSVDGKSGKPVQINGSVHQVWVVPDLKDSASTFKTLLERYGVPQKDISTAVSGNSFKVQSLITKGQLVNLVKSCKGAGFELITPQAPQPEQNTFSGRASDPVFFSAELLQNEQPR